jgi:hypothetical protein
VVGRRRTAGKFTQPAQEKPRAGIKRDDFPSCPSWLRFGAGV